MVLNLETVRQNVIECTKCDLCKTRTHAVPGKGNFHSDVMIVGEAPGKNEDLQGEPFVGIAGKKLSLVLENAGISREDVYITNTVKCRPPKNRVPSVLEKETCQEYIQKEIEIIKPKIICVLGNTAFGSILGGTEITKFRGKVGRKDNQLYFITLHPAATIYQQDLMQVLKDDFKKLFGLIRELKNGRQITIDIEFAS
ncbi:MAG TPA: uracil-DNA glycosylase [Nitrosopumilaceae archaeon]|nr:uracil-DNA glycosylase [Nitrosopumilaceae archaeon]